MVGMIGMVGKLPYLGFGSKKVSQRWERVSERLKGLLFRRPEERIRTRSAAAVG